jgi:orotidine-5'-phosphate decarboxylase
MAGRSHLCVGIDPHPAALAAWGLADSAAALPGFAAALLDAAEAGGAAAVKPQSALFERHGAAGVAALEQVLAGARQRGLLSILDVKRGDIGSTMAAYAQAYLDDAAPLAADACTLSPYLGFASLAPALELAAKTGRGVFVLAFTSNPEGAAVQHAVTRGRLSVGESMIQAAAEYNAAWRAARAGRGAADGSWGPGAGRAGGAALGPAGLVVGATIGSLRPLGRKLIAQVGGPILAPGVGAQGAGPAELERLFGQARGLVLATASRAVAAAGPGGAELAGAVRRLAQAVAFLGN